MATDQGSADRRRRVSVERALQNLCSAGVVAIPVLLVLGQAAADIAVSTIAVLFILRCLLSADWRWLEEPWVLVGLAVWVYLMLNAAYVAEDQDLATHRAAPFGRFVVFAAALQFWLLTDRAVMRRLLLVLTAVLAFVAADCLLQYATGSDLFGRPRADRFRLTGPFADPIPGSFLSYLCFPVLALGWGAVGRSRGRLALMAAGTAALGLAIALTGERAALFMYAFGLGLLVLLLPEARRPLLATGMIGALLLAATLALQPAMQERLIGHTSADFTDFWERRVGELLLRGQKVWWDNPVFGVGSRNFRRECERDDFEPRGPVETRCYTHPHHVWNEWLAETGLVGSAGFLALLVLWGRTIARGIRRAGGDHALLAGLLIALIVFLWPLRPSMSFFSVWLAAMFWLITGWALALSAPFGRAGAPEEVNSPS